MPPKRTMPTVFNCVMAGEGRPAGVPPAKRCLLPPSTRHDAGPAVTGVRTEFPVPARQRSVPAAVACVAPNSQPISYFELPGMAEAEFIQH